MSRHYILPNFSRSITLKASNVLTFSTNNTNNQFKKKKSKKEKIEKKSDKKEGNEMKKNNIYICINRIWKRNFEEALQKKKIKLTPKKSQLQLRVRASFVCRRSFTPYSFLSTIPYFSFVRYFLLCHVNNNKSRVSFQREESG